MLLCMLRIWAQKIARARCFHWIDQGLCPSLCLAREVGHQKDSVLHGCSRVWKATGGIHVACLVAVAEL